LDANPQNGSPPDPSFLAKQLVFIEWDLISHHIEGCPGQFIRKGLGSNSAVALSHFPLVKTLGLRTRSHGKVGGFNIGLGKILVAVFAVTFPLFLFVGSPFAFNTPAVGAVITGFGKPADIANLKHDREP
jgi:hypothetical protein